MYVMWSKGVFTLSRNLSTRIRLKLLAAFAYSPCLATSRKSWVGKLHCTAQQTLLRVNVCLCWYLKGNLTRCCQHPLYIHSTGCLAGELAGAYAGGGDFADLCHVMNPRSVGCWWVSPGFFSLCLFSTTSWICRKWYAGYWLGRGGADACQSPKGRTRGHLDGLAGCKARNSSHHRHCMQILSRVLLLLRLSQLMLLQNIPMRYTTMGWHSFSRNDCILSMFSNVSYYGRGAVS